METDKKLSEPSVSKEFSPEKSPPPEPFKKRPFSIKLAALALAGLLLTATSAYFLIRSKPAKAEFSNVKIPRFDPDNQGEKPLTEAEIANIPDEPAPFEAIDPLKAEEEFNRQWNTLIQKQSEIDALAAKFDPEATLKFPGLRNRDENSCFFNSAIQLLYRSRRFRRLVKANAAVKPLAALFHAMDSNDDFRVHSPLTELIAGKNLIDKEQHNSDEIVTYLYGSLGEPEEMRLDCKHVVIDYDGERTKTVAELPVCLKDSGNLSISQMLENYFATEKLDELTTKKVDLVNAPEILVLTVTNLRDAQRFQEPEKEIELGGKTYRLIGFTLRTGKIDGSGHFIAFIPYADGTYVGINDMRVNTYTAEQIQNLQGNPNMVIYEEI